MNADSPWLVVGLGNPGPQYAGNRHNIGAMVVDHLAAEAGVTLRTHKARARASTARLGGPGGTPVVLAIPSTYMNESGKPVSALARFYSVPPERIVIVHDELDIDAGAIKLKCGGGEGGHNGLRSISSSLGTKDYYRVRVGVGRPPGRMDASAYVLGDFSRVERAELPFVIDRAGDAVRELVSCGLVAAQQRFHGSG